MEYFKLLGNGPINPKAAALVPADMANRDPGSPANIAMQVLVDATGMRPITETSSTSTWTLSLPRQTPALQTGKPAHTAGSRLPPAIKPTIFLRASAMTANSTQDTETELFNCKYSFMGVPFSTNVSQSKAAIIGIPFDCGTHPTRIGSRQGPQSIREQSALVRPYQPPLADFNPLTRLNVVDCGDVDVTPGVIEESFDRIEAAITRVAQPERYRLPWAATAQ